jgi:hypothetical protein
MANKNPEPKKNDVSKVAAFDKGPKDFFRGSQGFNTFKSAKANNRTFIGMRRGSR